MQAHAHLTIEDHAHTGERSLRTTGIVEKGEELLRIPHSLMLTVSNVDRRRGSSIGSYPLQDGQRLVFALLTELLEQATGSPSLWSPYLAALPSKFSTPLFFNATERLRLQGSELLRWTRERDAGMLSSLHALNALLERHVVSAAVGSRGDLSRSGRSTRRAFEQRDVSQAFSMLWSRVYMVRVRDPSCQPDAICRKPALVPVGDLMNHAPAAEANVYPASEVGGELSGSDAHSEGTYAFYASRRIVAGEELTLRYGGDTEPSNALLMVGVPMPLASHPSRQSKLHPPCHPPAHARLPWWLPNAARLRVLRPLQRRRRGAHRVGRAADAADPRPAHEAATEPAPLG